ncbi:CpaF family protein, partial [Arthrobacter deserti]|nr:CpaF family protein [Arthrobacter deserti]
AGGNISSSFVVPTVASCIDLVVHCARSSTGRRQVVEIVSVGRRVGNGVIETSTVFSRQAGDLIASPSASPGEEKFARAGFNVMQLLGGKA